MKITKQMLSNGATLFVLTDGEVGYIEINVPAPVARQPTKMIENLKIVDPDDEEGETFFNAALDGFYSLLLALAADGHDLTTMEGVINTALDNISNEFD